MSFVYWQFSQCIYPKWINYSIRIMGVEYTTFRHWCVCVYACVFNFKQIIEWHKFRMKNKIQMWESICVECIRCFWRNHLSINNNFHLRMSHIHKKTDKLIFSLFVCLFVCFPMAVAASSLAPFICPSSSHLACRSFAVPRHCVTISMWQWRWRWQSTIN